MEKLALLVPLTRMPRETPLVPGRDSPDQIRRPKVKETEVGLLKMQRMLQTRLFLGLDSQLPIQLQ